jgi:hypothetical protein
MGSDAEIVPVYKASPTRGQKIRDLILIVHEEFPPFDDNPGDTFSSSARYERARERHAHNAKLVADALWACLPGGTLDALLGHLLTTRGSLLRVPHRSAAVAKWGQKVQP